jgi:hypothetical protein
LLRLLYTACGGLLFQILSHLQVALQVRQRLPGPVFQRAAASLRASNGNHRDRVATPADEMLRPVARKRYGMGRVKARLVASRPFAPSFSFCFSFQSPEHLCQGR